MPLAPRGIFIAAVALAALVTGILRADLAALFWGSTFVLVSAYGAAGCLLVRRRLARRRTAGPGFLDVTLPAVVPGPGSEAEALVVADLPRAFLPGIGVRVVLEPAWHDRVLGPIGAALGPGESRLRLRFTAARRTHRMWRAT